MYLQHRFTGILYNTSKMKKILQFSLAAAGLLVTTLASAQTQKLTLKKAAKYEAVSEMTSNTSAEAMGQTMEMTVATKNTTQYEVTDVRGGEFDLAKTLTKTAVNFSMMGQEKSYDSEKKDNDAEMAETIGANIGKPSQLTINEKGELLKSSAPKESAEMNMMAGMMVSASVSEADELLTPATLNRELKPGLQWQDSSGVKKEKMSMKITGVYTVNSIENGQALITFNGMQQITTTMEQMGMEMTATGNNKVTKNISIDLATGLTVQQKTTIALNISTEVAGMSIPATGTATMTTVVKPAQ